MVRYSCLNLASDPSTGEREAGFHFSYIRFIGCGRVIKSLALELRWRVKTGDKSIDEKGWNFFCACLWGCECRRASSGSWLRFHKSSGDKRGELDRDYSVSTLSSCHSWRNTSCAERDWDGKKTYEKARGDDESDNALLSQRDIIFQMTRY